MIDVLRISVVDRHRVHCPGLSLACGLREQRTTATEDRHRQSLGWLDENGRGIRYQYPYYNEPDPTVPRVPIRGRAALPADRIDPGVSGPPAR